MIGLVFQLLCFGGTCFLFGMVAQRWSFMLATPRQVLLQGALTLVPLLTIVGTVLSMVRR